MKHTMTYLLDAQFQRMEENVESILECHLAKAECFGKEELFKTRLRTLRRHIEMLLGERDDCGELLPDSIHKAPAFCRRECAGQGPNCGHCDHGGYGPDGAKEATQ